MAKGFGKSDQKIYLSLCVIAKNEAHRLANCLQSVANFVDEIVVVDTGSTDKTIKVAKQFTSKVFKFQWCDDFSKARNYALRQAKGEWVLVLDADETLNAAVIPLLQELMQNQDYVAINLLRHEVGADQTPYSLVSRLFRRHKELYFQGLYHESIDHSVQNLIVKSPHWRVVNTEIVAIEHYGYQNSEIISKNKLEFAKRLMTKHLTVYPQDSYIYSKLGALHLEIGDRDLGLQLLQTGLSFATQQSNELVIFELYYHLALAYSQTFNWETAQHYYQAAINLVNVPAIAKLPAYNNLGNLYQSQGQPLEAIAAYQKVTEIAPQFAKGHYNLGIALKAAGKLTQASSAYSQAIALQPDYAEAYQNLGVVMVHLGLTTEAIAAFNQAILYHEYQKNFASAQLIRDGLQTLGLAQA